MQTGFLSKKAGVKEDLGAVSAAELDKRSDRGGLVAERVGRGRGVCPRSICQECSCFSHSISL